MELLPSVIKASRTSVPLADERPTIVCGRMAISPSGPTSSCVLYHWMSFGKRMMYRRYVCQMHSQRRDVTTDSHGARSTRQRAACASCGGIAADGECNVPTHGCCAGGARRTSRATSLGSRAREQWLL